jgi:hypothetical protein
MLKALYAGLVDLLGLDENNLNSLANGAGAAGRWLSAPSLAPGSAGYGWPRLVKASILDSL